VLNLNLQQQNAVKFIDTPLFVLAGAGSGKTKVITSKIAYLIDKCGIKASNIVAVTFTNKAGKEMQARVKTALSSKQTRGLTVATFHTFGLKIIRKHCKELGLTANFTIADSQDVLDLIASITKKDQNEDKEKIVAIAQKISNWKNQLVTPDTALSTAKDDLEQQQALSYQEYQRILTAYNMVDFDDLISKPVYLFKTNNDILKIWQYKVHYLLIDEYQDTNIAQYELVKTLIQHSGKLTVVGDDDQSIYSWRGANPNNLTMLQQDYPSLRVIKLEQNYRSTTTILQSANALIANNSHLYDKKLWSELGIGDKIQVIKCDNEEKEAERVAAEILTHKLRMQTRYNQYAILFRSNFQSRILEFKLQEYAIPYQLNGSVSFFSRAEIKDIMCYLRLLINPEDDNAFLRIVNTPRRELGPVTLAKLSDFARVSKLSLVQACEQVDLSKHLTSKHIKKLTDFTNWLQRLRQLLSNSDQPLAIIKQLIAESGYEDFIHKHSNSHKQAESKIKNINLLLSNIERRLSSIETTDDDINAQENTVEKVISSLILQDILERQEEEQQQDKVQLLTIHASKGLEFNHVFIIGVEENIIPHKNSIISEDIDEERRLMYVGITRAKKTIALTMAASRRIANEAVDSLPSRFIDEIPENMVDFNGFCAENSKELKKQVAKSGLESLYQSLNM
jgi:ATP-dependent DNA helicase Rep